MPVFALFSGGGKTLVFGRNLQFYELEVESVSDQSS